MFAEQKKKVLFEHPNIQTPKQQLHFHFHRRTGGKKRNGERKREKEKKDKLTAGPFLLIAIYDSLCCIHFYHSHFKRDCNKRANVVRKPNERETQKVKI